MRCALCEKPTCQVEQLAEGWRLCGSMGFAYRLDESGEVVEWAVTNRSHPRGFIAEEDAVVAKTKSKSRAR